jgi:hypothetical protein
MCCSGPFSAYRASVIDEVKDRYVSQTFLGEPATIGDDRHLTNLVLERGHRTVFENRAVAYTQVPETLRGYLRQQVRWNRSFYREALWTLRHVRRPHPYLVFDLVLQALLPFMLVAALALTVYAVDARHLARYAAFLVAIAFLRSAYGLVRTRSWGFLAFMAYGFLHVGLLIPARLYAIATLRRSNWGTRGLMRLRSSAGPIHGLRLARAATAGLLVALVMALALPRTALADPAISEFGHLTSGSDPYEIVSGPDGNLWFTEIGGNRIGRIGTKGAIKPVAEFGAGLSANAGLGFIAAGSDGNLWFPEYSVGKIGRITTSGTITEFSAGLTPGSGPNGIATGPDGNLWFTEYNNVGAIGWITTSGTVTEFSAGLTPGRGPNEITTGPDGNLWFTEYINPGAIGRITPSGQITEFTAGLTPNSGPWSVAAGSDGNLWFTEFNSGAIGRITPSGQITEFTAGLTPNSGPAEITAGPDGNLWFTEQIANQIGQITRSGQIAEYSRGLRAGSNPVGITQGPDGNLWFAEYSGNRTGNRIGRVIIGTTSSSGSSKRPSRPGSGGHQTIRPGATISPAGAVTIGVRSNRVRAGARTVISGQVTGPRRARVKVTLHESPIPYGVAATYTDAAGRYRFIRTPAANARYQVVASLRPPGALSDWLRVLVSPNVTLRVGPGRARRGVRRVRRGQRLVFSGFAYPSRAGARVKVQWRTPRGRFRRVARGRIRDLGGHRLVYRVAVKIRRSGVYRVWVEGDRSHVAGTSSTRRIRVARARRR